jgi:predicted nucleic acid-binding protein
MIAVDASVCVKWILPEDHSDRALALVADSARQRQRLISTQLLLIETNNTLRQRVRREGLSLDEARGLLELAQGFGVTIPLFSAAEQRLLHERALVLADRFSLPAVYDAYYLALSEARQCPLWTDDRRLLQAVGTGGPDVHWIGDYESR